MSVRTDQQKKAFSYAWVILLALCVIRSLAAAGINNIGGLFLSPVAKDLNIGVGSLSIYFSVSSIATLLFMPVAGKLIHRCSIKLMMAVAVVLQAGSFIALGFMHNVWAWYLLSIPMGVGGAVLVNLAGPLLIRRWFQSKAGTALGVLMACAGLFGIFIQPATLKAIENIGWRYTYMALGAIVGSVSLLLTLLLIRNAPEKTASKADAAAPKQSPSGGGAMDISLKEAVKSPSFYGLLLFMISITAFAAFAQHLATYGEASGYSATQMGSVLSVSMIGSTLGAVLIGIVSDKIGVFKTTVSILIVVAASIVCLALGSATLILLMIGSFLLGLSAMGIPVLSPLLTMEFFGVKDYESIYANVMMGPPFATVVLLPLYGFLFDKMGSYTWVLIIMGIFAALGVAGLAIARKGRKKAA